MPVFLLLQSFPLRESNLRPSCVPWVRDEAYGDRDDPSVSVVRPDAAVAADGVDEAQVGRNLHPVYPAFGPGEPCHGG